MILSSFLHSWLFFGEDFNNSFCLSLKWCLTIYIFTKNNTYQFCIMTEAEFCTCDILNTVKHRTNQYNRVSQFIWRGLLAQWLEHLPWQQETRVRFPATPPIFLTFQTEGLANPCNPATWKFRVEEGVGWIGVLWLTLSRAAYRCSTVHSFITLSQKPT